MHLKECQQSKLHNLRKNKEDKQKKKKYATLFERSYLINCACRCNDYEKRRNDGNGKNYSNSRCACWING
jgi:hypothetical protein